MVWTTVHLSRGGISPFDPLLGSNSREVRWSNSSFERLLWLHTKILIFISRISWRMSPGTESRPKPCSCLLCGKICDSIKWPQRAPRGIKLLTVIFRGETFPVLINHREFFFRRKSIGCLNKEKKLNSKGRAYLSLSMCLNLG